MARAHFLLGITVLIFTTTAIRSSPPPKAAPPKALIFDLANVLSKTNSWSFVSTMGSFTILSYAFKKRTLPWNLGPIITERLFAMLNRCDYALEPGVKRACTPKGVPFPPLLQGYQAGKVLAADASALIRATMETLRSEQFFSYETEATVVERAAMAIFTPHTYAAGQEIIPDSATLLKELAALTDEQGNKRFKLFALSNWDKESFPLFKAAHEEVFACFDKIYISGDLGVVKPNTAIFFVVLSEQGLTVDECIFIDDQKENIEAAERINIRSHLFTDAHGLRFSLSSFGINLTDTRAHQRNNKKNGKRNAQEPAHA